MLACEAFDELVQQAKKNNNTDQANFCRMGRGTIINLLKILNEEKFRMQHWVHGQEFRSQTDATADPEKENI